MDSWEFGVQIRKSAKEQGLSCCYGCYHCYSFLSLSAKFLFFLHFEGSDRRGCLTVSEPRVLPIKYQSIDWM